MDKIFVYGTLKSNEGNNHFLRNSKFVALAQTQGKLYKAGIPYMVVRGSSDQDVVYGEVWEVEYHEAHRIDQLEAGYLKTEITVWYNPDGATSPLHDYKAYAYVLDKAPEYSEYVESGVY